MRRICQISLQQVQNTGFDPIICSSKSYLFLGEAYSLTSLGIFEPKDDKRFYLLDFLLCIRFWVEVYHRARFLIQYCQKINSKDFVVKTEDLTRRKKGKRQYLNNQLTREMMKQMKLYFESYVKVLRMKVGKKQTIETLINEETLVFAKFVRNEHKIWIPRVS
jgi:hypothetical protein